MAAREIVRRLAESVRVSEQCLSRADGAQVDSASRFDVGPWNRDDTVGIYSPFSEMVSDSRILPRQSVELSPADSVRIGWVGRVQPADALDVDIVEGIGGCRLRCLPKS